MKRTFTATSTNDKAVTIAVPEHEDKTLQNAKDEDLSEYTIIELENCLTLQEAIKNGDVTVKDQDGKFYSGKKDILYPDK